jgi:hypothetical protein
MGCELLAKAHRRRRLGRGGVVGAVIVAFVPASARAEPLRLRADAVAQTQTPTGLLVLSGEDRARPWVDAEALVWAGGRPEAAADVLVLSVRLRDPQGRGELRVGRMVVATGAIRPLQIDGASGLLRSPWGTSLESFAGAPVVPRFGERLMEFAGGGRVAQTVGSGAVAGVSYAQVRGHGEVDREELGADLALMPVKWLDVAARGAYDLQSPGLAEAVGSAAARAGAWRLEGFASQRSPSRLLPATSLFSVLGDQPSRSVGSTLRWQAAPRLELLGSGAVQSSGGAVGGNGWVRGRLWLDDRGDSSVGVELRRQSVGASRWTGARAVFSLAMGGGFRCTNELELALPDEEKDGVFAWPWALVGLSWRSRRGWEIAGALEASSTPQNRYETTALARLSRSWEVSP